jgi:hypothetical protein
MAIDPTGLPVQSGRYSVRWREHDVEDDKSLDARDQSGLASRADDARVLVDFSIGPSGVGPVTGFDSGDFFPSAPAADIDRNRTD